MPNIRQGAFDGIARLDEAASVAGVVEELRKLGRLFGYESFCIAGLPEPGERFAPYVLVSGWPEGWMRRYDENGYAHVDPVMAQIRRTSLPVAWSEAPYDRSDPGPSRVMNESPEFGLVEGVSVSVSTPKGIKAGASFSAGSFKPTKSERAALHLVALYAEGRARALLGGEESPAPAPVLSPRQLECLKWAAEGRTAWEISVILSLSQRTVEQYLAGAAAALGAVNRVQAVAEAMRRGIID
ncbi:MAG TPA: LuxR family transcriptional regulator [Beijerinckiaceae bacterium]